MEDDDPTADFLAREQAILGADAALFGNPLGTGVGGGAGLASPGNSLLDDIDQLVPAVATQPTKIHNASSTDLLDGGSTGLLFSSSSDNKQDQAPQTSFFSNPAPVEQEEEIIPIPKSQELLDWQVAFDAKVLERDAKAKEKHDRMLVDAKEALERFYAEYNEKKAKSISRNKESEAQTVAQMETKGNVWERVLKQIEVAPKPKVDSSAAAKKNPSAIVEEKKAAKKVNNETMRFKQILTSLKADPNAPGLATA